jgi:recombination protein RecT
MSDLTRPATAPAVTKFKPLSEITRVKDLWDNDQFKSIIARALPRHLTPDRMVSTFGIAVQKTPKLAQCSIPSLIGAFMSCSAMGLEPNTALQHAYLIPFDVRKNVNGKWQTVRTDVQLIVGYRGYLHLAYQNEQVQSIHCDVVWEGDEFSYEHGTNAHLRHVQGRDASKRGEEPIFAYMHAKLKGGGEVFEVLTRADVHSSRARSQGYQTAMKAFEEAKQKGSDPRKDKRYTEAPWIRDAVAMWRKTAMRAGQKWLPQSVVMAVAESLDDSRARFDPATDFKNVMDGTWEPIPEEGDEDEDDGNNAPSVSPPAVTQQQPPIVVQQPVEPPPKPARAARTTAVNRANTPQQAASPPPVPRQAAPPPPAEDEPPADRWGEDPGISGNSADAPGISDNAPPTDDAPRPFEAYVFDAQGEAASDVWTNAIGFARQFAFIAQHVTAEEWPAFLEFNNDGIYEAREASREAADIIDAVQAPAPGTVAPSEPANTGLTLIPVQESRGSPDYVGWLNAVAPAIKALTAHTLLEWTEAHVPMVQTAPPTQRIKFASMISERATSLGIGTPTIVSTLMPSARKPQEPPAQEQATAAPDPVERAANALLADIASFRTAGEGREWLLNAAVKSRGAMVRDARPDLNQAIERAYTAKLAELQG